MATSTKLAPARAAAPDAVPFTRVLQEGYGPGAWHGADLKAALADVPEPLAFWRPGRGRHSIAEIALHHAYCVQSVVNRFTGRESEPFVLEGSDWFELPNPRIAWSGIVGEVEARQRELAEVVASVDAGRLESPLSRSEQFDLVLGAACHAVYHAGQIQLIKVLQQSA